MFSEGFESIIISILDMGMSCLKLNIVLIEPEIPQNTGNIARTCAATGAALHLVGPMGFSISNKMVKRAGLDYWDEVEVNYYDNFVEFLEKTNAAECGIDTTNRYETKLKDNFYMASTKATHTYSEIEYKDECYVLFGKESYGLPEPLLAKNAEGCLRIPMRENLRSLNLSNSVAIVAYEYFRQKNFEGLINEGHLTGRKD